MVFNIVRHSELFPKKIFNDNYSLPLFIKHIIKAD